jgi:hypothetical protein
VERTILHAFYVVLSCFLSVLLCSTDVATPLGFCAGEWVEPHSKHHVSKELCQLIDVDGDQLVSFHEYLFLLALLSIPLRDIETVFRVVDLDGNGQLDAQEFAAILHMLQAKAGLIGDKPRTGRTFNHKAVSLYVPTHMFKSASPVSG